MKVDTTRTVKNLDGTDLQVQVSSDEEGKTRFEALTLKTVMVNSLMSNDPNDKVDGARKAKRWNLALQVQKEDVVELSAEQITMVKKLIGQVYATAVVGPAFKMLEDLESKTLGEAPSRNRGGAIVIPQGVPR